MLQTLCRVLTFKCEGERREGTHLIHFADLLLDFWLRCNQKSEEGSNSGTKSYGRALLSACFDVWDLSVTTNVFNVRGSIT